MGLSLPALLLLGFTGCSSPPGTAPAAGAGAASRPRVWRPAHADTLGPVVAIVGRRHITSHEVDSLLATAPANTRSQYYTSSDQYRQVVERMVEREAIYQAAKRDGTERDSAYQSELASYGYDLLTRHYFSNQLKHMPEPSDSAIAAYYNEHGKEFDTPARARVRHILVRTEAKAREARQELKRGGSWGEVVKRYSTDVVSKGNGGLLGYVTNEGDAVPGVGKAPAITAAAFSLKEGEVSQPLRTAKGWHLISVDDVHAAARTPLSEVRERIGGILQGRIEDEFSNALIDSLKRYSGATIFDDSIAVALRPARTPQQLFEQAQATIPPLERIERYRQLAAKFPQERVSEQAAFMVGFTYAEDLSDFENARKSFAEFLSRYPHSDLVKSAQWMLDNMNKPAPPFEGEAPADSSDDAPSSGGSISLPDTLHLTPGHSPADSSRGGGEPKQ
jgi:hypothetical protein